MQGRADGTRPSWIVQRKGSVRSRPLTHPRRVNETLPRQTSSHPKHADPIPLDGTAPFGPRGPRGRISPNGRWLAYEAETSGRREIYVTSFPDGAGGSWQISSEGGIEPQWRGDGRELFFLGADKRMMAVPVTTDDAFRAGTPMALFSTELDPLGLPITGRNQYQVAADGQRFLINQLRGEGAPSPVTVLVNWPEAVKRSMARLSHSTR
jgi:hypothetical protein